MSGLLAASSEDVKVASLFGNPARKEVDEDKPKKKKKREADENAAAAPAEAPVAASAEPVVNELEDMVKSGVRTEAEEKERLTRTVFVGNLPVDAKPKTIKRHFAEYGAVEAVRLRSAAAANPKMSQRAAVITGELSGDVVSAYVVFADAPAALAAIRASGQQAFGRHLRVDAATPKGAGSASTKLHDARKSVFLGNLPHSVSEETLWSLFEPCGRVTYVRLIREPKTQLGKGFGYVGFHEAGSVERALLLHGTKVASAAPDAAADGAPTEKKEGAGRPIRVFRCSAGKSHSRLADQGRKELAGGPKKRKRADEKGAADEPAAQRADDASGQRAGVGWQQRERRRLQKKLEGRLAKKKGSGAGAAAAAGSGSGGAIAKSIMKAAGRVAARSKGGKASKGGPAGQTSKTRKEAKGRALAKRAKSKQNKQNKLADSKKGR